MKKEIEIWLEKAEHDSKVAKKLYEEKFYSDNSFYCQQAIKKALSHLFNVH